MCYLLYLASLQSSGAVQIMAACSEPSALGIDSRTSLKGQRLSGAMLAADGLRMALCAREDGICVLAVDELPSDGPAAALRQLLGRLFESVGRPLAV